METSGSDLSSSYSLLTPHPPPQGCTSTQKQGALPSRPVQMGRPGPTLSFPASSPAPPPLRLARRLRLVRLQPVSVGAQFGRERPTSAGAPLLAVPSTGGGQTNVSGRRFHTMVQTAGSDHVVPQVGADLSEINVPLCRQPPPPGPSGLLSRIC